VVVVVVVGANDCVGEAPAAKFHGIGRDQGRKGVAASSLHGCIVDGTFPSVPTTVHRQCGAQLPPV
jgi:hypothetical protein